MPSRWVGAYSQWPTALQAVHVSLRHQNSRIASKWLARAILFEKGKWAPLKQFAIDAQPADSCRICFLPQRGRLRLNPEKRGACPRCLLNSQASMLAKTYDFLGTI